MRDAEDWNLRGNRCEVFERRMAVHRDMWTRSGRDSQIPTKDRRPHFNSNVFQKHGFALAAPEHSPTLGRSNVANPVRSLTEHRDKISLAIPVGNHHRQ
jgi:hypothetical protein